MSMFAHGNSKSEIDDEANHLSLLVVSDDLLMQQPFVKEHGNPM